MATTPRMRGVAWRGTGAGARSSSSSAFRPFGLDSELTEFPFRSRPVVATTAKEFSIPPEEFRVAHWLRQQASGRIYLSIGHGVCRGKSTAEE
uniref:Uncharacterized protein n=1 Tax=Oryza punctata TaxID=4537 RepID=A0A0E0KB44_ORYPU